MYKQFIIIKNQDVQISFWIISKIKPDQTTRNIDQTGDNTELITVSESEDQNEHSVELITECISLKKTVKELQSQLMEVTKRVTLLEGELDKLKSLSPEVANESTKYSKKPEIPRLIEVKADVHHDQYGNKQTVNNDRLTQKNDNMKSLNGDDFSGAENPFRHTDKEGKNILRKPRPKPVEKLKPVAIKPSKQSSARTYLVYIGKLDRDTSEDSVRCHLAEIGIDSDDIADIIKLKSKNNDESSFCISLNTMEANEAVLADNQWPKGIRVRKYFRDFKSMTYSRNKSEKSPRFRNKMFRKKKEKSNLNYMNDKPRNLDYVGLNRSRPERYIFREYPTLGEYLPQFVTRARRSYMPESHEYYHQRFRNFGQNSANGLYDHRNHYLKY